MTKAHQAFAERAAKRAILRAVRSLNKQSVKPAPGQSVDWYPSTPKEAFTEPRPLWPAYPSGQAELKSEYFPEPSFNQELAEYDFEPSLGLDAETERRLDKEAEYDNDPELPMGESLTPFLNPVAFDYGYNKAKETMGHLGRHEPFHYRT